MTTRYFHPPVIVWYLGDEDWHQALALGVRRTKHDRYHVLIIERRSRGTENTRWVPRSRIRAADAAMTPCATPAEHRRLPRLCSVTRR